MTLHKHLAALQLLVHRHHVDRRASLPGWLGLQRAVEELTDEQSTSMLLSEAEDLALSLVDAVALPSNDQWDEDEDFWWSLSLQYSLVYRAALDLAALQTMLRGAHYRSAAALSRTTYETAGWLSVLARNPANQAVYRHWDFEDLLRAHKGRVAEHKRIKSGQETPKDPELFSELLQGADEIARHQRAELLATSGALLERKTKSGKRRVPSSFAGSAESLGQSMPYPVFSYWAAAVYNPSSRILHACDATDFLHVESTNGVVGVVDGVQIDIQRRHLAIVQSCALSLLFSLPDSAELLLQFAIPPLPEEEGGRARLLETLASIAQTAKVVGDYASIPFTA